MQEKNGMGNGMRGERKIENNNEMGRFTEVYEDLDILEDNCPAVIVNNQQLIQNEDVKYIGIQIDDRLS